MTEEISYTAFPMRESPGKAIVFWLVVIFTLWAVWWNVQSLLVTVVAGLVLLGSLSSFFLKTTYRIDSEGASSKRYSGTRTIEWSRVRAIYPERDGLFLSAFLTRSMMENFRGLYLPYRGNESELLNLVRMYAPNARGWKDDESAFQATSPTSNESSRNYFGHRREK